MSEKKDPMDFGNRTITVWGETIQVNVRKGLPIADVSRDMDNVASEMAWWSSVWAKAEEEAEGVDAHYRAWRAKKTEEILAEDSKMSEWKVKAKIEADPKFTAFKMAAAKCTDAITVARGIVNAFDKKANALQSKGAMMRKELGATGMTTPAVPHSAASPEPEYGTEDSTDADYQERKEERETKVRGIFRNKKGKS